MPDTSQLRLLLVDEDEPVLTGLQRMLRPLTVTWDIVLAFSPEEARTLLATEPFDVVITELRFSQGDGTALLDSVRQESPGTLRIILSSFLDSREMGRLLQLAHLTIPKPATSEEIRQSVQRARSLVQQLKSHRLGEALDQFSDVLPRPRIFPRLQQLLESPTAGVADVAKVVAQDGVISAKLLRLVNSAGYGLTQTVSSIDRAISLIGLSQVKSLVLASEAFGAVTSAPLPPSFSYSEFEDRSLRRSGLARGLVTSPRDLDLAGLAGLLSGMGELIIASRMPEIYELVRASAPDRVADRLDLEQQYLGLNHAELGAMLLNLWNLPLPLVEAVAYQYDPQEYLADSGEVTPLAALAIADTLLELGSEFPDAAALAAQLEPILPPSLRTPNHIQNYLKRGVFPSRNVERTAA